MKRQTITINGETFELFKSESSESEPIIRGAVYDEIYDVYDRPSQFKVNVWRAWCDWCFELNASDNPCTLSICSHNCMQFSISGKVLFDGKLYSLWITRDHNRAYLIG